MGYRLFNFGLILLPFDNLIFAPSSGWATVSPFLFFSAFFLSIIESKKTNYFIMQPKSFIIVVAVIFQTICAVMWYGFHTSLFVNAILTLVLGASFYFCLNHYVLNPQCCRLNEFVKYITIGYLASLFYGVVYFIAFKLHISPLISIFELLQKRAYGERFSMSFTEPSFASIHVFGVLFVIYFSINYLSNISQQIEVKTKSNFNKLFFYYLGISLLIVSSARYKLDFIIIVSLLSFYLIAVSKRSFSNKFFICIMFFILFISIVSNPDLLGDRINRIISNPDLYSLMNSDASLASRWFRIESLFSGHLLEPVQALFGYGLSNASIPFNNGFTIAELNYTNNFTSEIDKLYGAVEDQYFNMQLRMVSEFGVILTGIILSILFDRRLIVLYFALFYLYMQFDSYAWYSVWLYLFIIKCLDTDFNLSMNRNYNSTLTN